MLLRGGRAVGGGTRGGAPCQRLPEGCHFMVRHLVWPEPGGRSRGGGFGCGHPLWHAHRHMVMHAPVHGRDLDAVAGLAGLRHHGLDLAQPRGVAARRTGHIHHHQKTGAAAVQRQHRELVADRKHPRPGHTFADH